MRLVPDVFSNHGAVMNYDRRHSNVDSGLPAAMTLNGPANQVSANDHIFPGFFAGFPGNRFNPMFVSQHANQPDFRPLPLLDNAQRLIQRKGLLDKLTGVTDRLQRTVATTSFGDYHQQAIRLLTSPKARRALDITLEEPRLRERYGELSPPTGDKVRCSTTRKSRFALLRRAKPLRCRSCQLSYLRLRSISRPLSA